MAAVATHVTATVAGRALCLKDSNSESSREIDPLADSFASLRAEPRRVLKAGTIKKGDVSASSEL
jgi:hypothetical protein